MRLGGSVSPFGIRAEENILNLPGLELRSLGLVAGSQPIYRLHYPTSSYAERGPIAVKGRRNRELEPTNLR
jgi:hypothetical protein